MKNDLLKKYLQSRNFNKWDDDTPQGCSAGYFKLPFGLGIKVYFPEGYKNPKNVVGCAQWWQAAKAMNVMNQANKVLGIAPRAYQLYPVKCGNYWTVGLVMDHVEGEHDDVSDRKRAELHRKLKKHGFFHNDMGAHNWKVQSSGKVVLIDWDWTYRSKRKKNR